MSHTAFDDFLEEQVADPERAQAYAETRAEVDAVDAAARTKPGTNPLPPRP